MTVVGITMVRDEEDIVGHTVGRMLDQCDYVIAADNNSVDGTRSILDTLATFSNLTVLDDPEVGYHQWAKMTRLAHLARNEFGATWVVPFDADEWWCAPGDESLVTWLPAVHKRFQIVSATVVTHVPTDADDPATTSPIERMPWRQLRPEPPQFCKVAVRPAPDLVIHMGNHDAEYSESDPRTPRTAGLTVHHFPYRTAEQFVSKIRNGVEAYAATDLPEMFGDHWRAYGRLLAEGGPEVLRLVFEDELTFTDPTSNHRLTKAPAPA